MKDGIIETLGKTVAGVVVKERTKSPHRQVFFVFSDGTHFELYGDDVQGISHVRSGGHEAVLEYMPSGRVLLDAKLET